MIQRLVAICSSLTTLHTVHPTTTSLLYYVILSILIWLNRGKAEYIFRIADLQEFVYLFAWQWCKISLMAMGETLYFISWQQSRAHPKQIPAWQVICHSINIKIKAATHLWNNWNWFTAWMSLLKFISDPQNCNTWCKWFIFCFNLKQMPSLFQGDKQEKSVCIGSVYYLYMDSMVLEHPHTSPITTIITIHSVCTKFGDISLLENWNSTLIPSKQHAHTLAHLDWLAWWARPACRRRAASAASHLDGRGAAWPRWTGGASALSARVSRGQAAIVVAMQQAKVPHRGRRGPRRSAASARRAALRRLLRPFLL